MSTAMELTEIKKQLDAVNTTVNDIYNVLMGSDHDKESGFISRVKELEVKMISLISFNQKMIYISIGMAIPSTYGMFKIFSVLVNLAK